MLHELLEIIDGRKVAIVGNGKEDEDRSAEIDSADIVIRFNHFYNYDSGKVGKRVDVIIQTFTSAWVGAKEKHANVIKEQLPKIFCGKKPEQYMPNTVAKYLGGDICVSDLSPELEPYCHFTTGGAFLAWLSSQKRNAEFKVYGFPRGEKADYYFANDAFRYKEVKDRELTMQERAIAILEGMKIEKPREERKPVIVIPIKKYSVGAPDKNRRLLPILLEKLRSMEYRKVIVGDDRELGEKMKADFGVEFFETPSPQTGEITDDLRLWRDMTGYHGEIIYIQCTAPKFKSEWVDACLAARKYAPIAATCVPVNFKVNSIYGCADGIYSPVVDVFGPPSVSRQKLPECVRLSGAVWVFHSDTLSRGSFYMAGTLRPVMIEEKDALDVDTIEELASALTEKPIS